MSSRWTARIASLARVRSAYQRELQVAGLFTELDGLSAEQARAVLLAMVEGVPAYRGNPDASPLRELERRWDVGAIPALEGLVARGCAARKTLAALRAVDGGCSCQVHKTLGSTPGPHMVQGGSRADATTWTTVTWGTCSLCGEPWTLRQESRDHGGTTRSWVE